MVGTYSASTAADERLNAVAALATEAAAVPPGAWLLPGLAAGRAPPDHALQRLPQHADRANRRRGGLGGSCHRGGAPGGRRRLGGLHPHLVLLPLQQQQERGGRPADAAAAAQPLAGAVARDHVPATVAQVAEAGRGHPVVALPQEPAADQVQARAADHPSDNR